jgi:protocatechuate 3,4-dioxygenase alpha subunit
VIFETTPSQTVGPYFSIGLLFDAGRYVVPEGTPGAIRIEGVVYDGAGEPITDNLIETWQADADGRCGYEAGDGSYEIITVKPGSVPGPGGGMQAPHIDISVVARGLLHRCVTRIYFPDEPDANAADPVLRTVPSGRRETLLAHSTEGGYRFDIRLQGADETVFFAL